MFASLVLPLLAAAAAVQSDGDRIAPRNYTVPGGAQAVAFRDFLYQQTARAEQRQCQARGCLVIVNETSGYDVTGLFLVNGERDGRATWTPNQFLRPLRPRSAYYTIKAGDDGMCALPARLELVERRSGEKLVMDTHAALCRRQRASTLLRIRVEVPTVTVEEGG